MQIISVLTTLLCHSVTVCGILLENIEQFQSPVGLTQSTCAIFHVGTAKSIGSLSFLCKPSFLGKHMPQNNR